MDTDALRALAADARHAAESLRTEADDLARRVEAVPWSGRAAQAMHLAVAEQRVALERAARRHDDAADALVAHADRVDDVAGLLPALGGLAGAAWAGWAA